MGHIISVIKFLFVQRRVGYYARSKEIALAIAQQRKPKVSLIDYMLYFWAKYCKCGCIKAFFRANLDNRLVVYFLLSYNRMVTAGTFSNYVATALLGFLGGVFFTFLYFAVVSVIIDMSAAPAFYVSVSLCVFFTIGLAFIQSVRCVTFSVIPEICTQQARSLLVSYALIMMITGPGSNILYNTHQLTETMTCTREQLRALQHNLTELYMKPFRALKRGIEHIVDAIRPVINVIKSVIQKIKECLIAVAQFIKKAFSWLNSLVPVCRNSAGTPFDRCYNCVEKTLQSCEVRTWWVFRFLCKLWVVVQAVCYPVKIVDVFCSVFAWMTETVFPYFETKMKEIGRFIKTLFYVSVTFEHSFAFNINQSATGGKVWKSVFAAEKERLSFFFKVFNLMKLALGAYILYVLFNAFLYRQKFFYSMSYDNYHVNKYMFELDWKRASVHRQTLFPLTISEKNYYVSLFSPRLTIQEQVGIIRESFFLALAVIKIIFLFLTDLSLHWVVTLIHDHGRLQFYFGNDQTKIEARGSGLWYTIYKVINNLLSPFDVEFNFNTKPCLPQPIPPAYPIYKKAAYTVGFAWIMLLIQPFGIRFRNYIMSVYYPDAARKRAVYLYNYILQTRGTISMYIRRNIFRRAAFGLRTDKPNLRKWLLAKVPLLKLILPYKDMLRECTLCGYMQPEIKCVTPDCPAYYCKDCFKETNYICIWCNMPQNYSGSTVSEEEDSDEEVEDLPDKSSKSDLKSGIIMSRLGDTIEMRDLEEARCSRSENVVIYTEIRDYFDDSWRRDHWAHIDEFLITWPDLNLWIRADYEQRFFD